MRRHLSPRLWRLSARRRRSITGSRLWRDYLTTIWRTSFLRRGGGARSTGSHVGEAQRSRPGRQRSDAASEA
eukprot:3534402-Pyramimonas_sp.AAC.1